MPKGQHKEVVKALRTARHAGFTVIEVHVGHVWGKVIAPSGQELKVWSSPRSPERWRSGSESSSGNTRREVPRVNTFVFRLTVAEPIDDDGANRLFDAGVEDGFPETGPAGHSIGFERQARSLRDAILSAISDVEAADFTVLRVEPDDLVSAADIAERTERSRQSISALINGSRGPGGWPRPVAGNVRSPLWRWSDVQAWFDAFEGDQRVDLEEATLVAAVNELLQARAALRRLKRRDRARLVRELVEPATTS